jgi:pectin methylesterase-like acyl-CoA thioesterase
MIMYSYNLRKLIGIIAILLIIIPGSFGQLVGTFSIGGINPDYKTISNAISDIAAKGTAGSVVFNIRPGTYPSFSIGIIQNHVYPDSIILQSETHDSTSVIINGTINLSEANGITIRWMTIENTGSSSNNAIVFSKSYHCNILNCLINTPNSKGDVL